MRAALLIVLALATACHRPARSPVRRLGDRLVAMSSKLAAIVKPVAANVDVKAVVRDMPRDAPRRVAGEPDDPPPAAAPAPAPAPTVHVNRVDAARPTVFVLRGQTHGGQALCETHTTSDACNTRCTSMLRANALAKPEPSTPKSCSCLEQDSGCQ